MTEIYNTQINEDQVRFSSYDITSSKTDKGRVFDYVVCLDIGERPSEIAKILEINPNSVRKYCSKLYEEGRIGRKDGGYYQRQGSLIEGDTPWVRLGLVQPIRLQNIHFQLNGVDAVRPVTWRYDGFEVRLTYGGTHRRVLGVIPSSGGILYETLDVVLDRCCDYVGSQLGVVIDPGAWVFTMCELFNDFLRDRIDYTVTKVGLRGELEKYYPKDDGMRHEVRTPRDSAFNKDDLYALVHGSMELSSVHSRVTLVGEEMWEVKQEIRKLTTAVLELRKEIRSGIK